MKLDFAGQVQFQIVNWEAEVKRLNNIERRRQIRKLPMVVHSDLHTDSYINCSRAVAVINPCE